MTPKMDTCGRGISVRVCPDEEEIPKEASKRVESICLEGEGSGGAGSCQFDSFCVTPMKTKINFRNLKGHNFCWKQVRMIQPSILCRRSKIFRRSEIRDHSTGRGLEQKFCNYLDWKGISAIRKMVLRTKRRGLEDKHCVSAVESVRGERESPKEATKKPRNTGVSTRGRKRR